MILRGKMRLDAYLADAGLAVSRTEARRLIEEGLVSVDGKEVKKPSFDISGREEFLSVKPREKSFVGRGGVKLEGAFSSFSVSAAGKRCIDVGASSGGFTDCLLQHGAEHVIAVDSGRGQLVESLRRDARVTSVEGFNARYMQPTDLEYVPELAVMDVSFISATYIIPALARCLREGADFILLIKPQFEVGREGVGKGGIVKKQSDRDAAVRRVVECAEGFGFKLKGLIESPIQGGDGNIEYLAHFVC